MAAVLEPDDASAAVAARSSDAQTGVVVAAASAPFETGLKPIERLTSDTRIAKIIPDSDAVTVLNYSSQFAREFIRSDYNFCASKIAVARGGKTRAIESALRETTEWMRKAIAWVEKHNAREIPLPSDRIELTVTRPLAGLLVRCLTQYDRLFARTLEAVVANKLSGEEREAILSNAARRIRLITRACKPDNDRYRSDGTLRDE